MEKPPAYRSRFMKIAGGVLIVLGVLLPLGAVTTGWSPASGFLPASEDEASVRLFTKQAVELKQRTSAREAAFMQRFARLPLASVLRADHLVTPEGRASGRATLKQFRGLVAERAAIRNDAWAELHRIIAAVPDAGTRNGAFAGANAHHAQAVARADELDQSQLQLADAYEAIMQWCESQGKTLTALNNELRLSTPLQQTQLEFLLADALKAEEHEHEIATRAQKTQQKFERNFDMLVKDAGTATAGRR